MFSPSGVGRGEGKRGSTSGSGSGAAFASSSLSLLSAEVPPDSGVDAAAAAGGGGESEASEEYEDDDEWEDEGDEGHEEDVTDPDGSASRRGRRGGRGAAGILSGPLYLERSFREGFASVNGTLSAIAAGTTITPPGGAFVDSSRDGDGAVRTTGGNNVDIAAVGRRGPKPSSSLSGEAVGGDVGREAAGLSSPPASPDPVSTAPSREVHQSRESGGGGSSGNGRLDAAFRLTPDKGGETATAESGGTAAGGGLGGRGGRDDEQLPAEMSGMLERYSEMMLRVVQVRITHVAKVVDSCTCTQRKICSRYIPV